MPHHCLNYLSICSGIEAATVAWHSLGWRPVAFSEIDPFARAVLAHHYPAVQLHGDFTTIDAGAHGTIDLLVGGTPCQSFSIAGLRKGLADDRGNLSLEFIRLAKAACARWVVWENVPGVLSIDRGRAFGSFLGGLAECGYGFAYRILDAQYFGVPQRRRRVFVVGYFGDWRPAAAVLFEREGLRGDIAPRREARKRIADSLTVGANQCGGRAGDIVEHETAYALEASSGGASGKEGRGLVTHTLRGDGFDASEEGTGRGTPLVAGTVSSKWAKGTGGPAGDECQNLIAFDSRQITSKINGSNPQPGDPCPTLHQGTHYIAIPLQEVGKRTGKSTDDASIGLGIGQDGDAMFTLQAAAQHGVAIPLDLRNAGRDAEKHDAQNRQGCGVGAAGDPASTLSTAFVPGVASFKPGQSADSRGIGYDDHLAPSLEAGGGGNNRPAIMQQMAVRRLTPRECERLQGFPDDYTLVPFRGKLAADGNRYKALGNSMAVPVMRWLGERIQEVEKMMG
jgi:DNA (cytosine-5)-methyltransferase 1